MPTIHTLLKRQLKREFGEAFAIPAEWRGFVDAVNEAYLEFDMDRAMLERSLELSSQELLQTNSELRAVFEAIPDILFRVDHRGVILSFKGGSTSDLMLEPKRLSGKRLQDIPVKDAAEQFRQAIQQVLATRTVVTAEYTLAPQPQAAPCTYEARFAPLLEDQIVVIIRNITEHKRAEGELRAAHQRLTDIIDFLPDATFVIDQDKRVIAWNHAIEDMTGVRKEEMLGRGDHAYAVPFYGEARPLLIDLIDAQHPEYHERYEYVRKKGHTLYSEVYIPSVFKGAGAHLWVTASPLLDRQGKRVGAIESVRDITERKRLEEQFRQVQKMEAIGQLAAGIAHDFNNILTAIQGNLCLLQMGELSPSEAASATQEAQLAAERAANLTRQLLTFSRRRPIQAKNLDLNEVVANMTRMLQRLVGEHIALETRYAPGGARIHADPGMIEQVLVNLAVNSRDAMPKGGRLVLETSTVEFARQPPAPREGFPPGAYVCLRITDTGTGIAPEHLPHIFEPFFTTKEVGRGTGLGLATVFGIVEQHRGWIDIQSQVQTGTSVTVFLPCLRPGTPLPEERLSEPVVRGGHETILLVEDDSSVRRLLVAILQRFGYRVHEADSGVAAWELLQSQAAAVDLLVTDMVMPGGLNGRDLAERARALKPGLKVIYCSGYTDDMLGPDSPLRNNVNFLEKPIDPRKLLRRVRDCLDQR